MDQGTYRDESIEEVFYFHLPDVTGGNLNFVGRELPIEGVYNYYVDVLKIDLENKRAEFVAVDRHPSVYSSLNSRVRDLEDDWSYHPRPNESRSVDVDKNLKGDYLADMYARDSETISRFFEEVLGYDVFERLDPVDSESLDL